MYTQFDICNIEFGEKVETIQTINRKKKLNYAKY